MDDGLLYFIIMLAISIVPSAIAAAKKKKKGAGQPEGGAQQESEGDNPWAVLQKYLDEARKEDEDVWSQGEEEFSEAVSEAEKPSLEVTTDTEYSNSRADSKYLYPEGKTLAYQPMVHYGATSQRIKIKEAFDENAIGGVGEEIGSENSLESNRDNAGVGHAANDFNLRDAILYSEILKPKFEE